MSRAGALLNTVDVAISETLATMFGRALGCGAVFLPLLFPAASFAFAFRTSSGEGDKLELTRFAIFRGPISTIKLGSEG